MTLRRLIHEFTFPDPREADAAGLVAFGGSLDPRRVLAAYAQGIFPWPYDSDSPVLWFSPDPRMVLRPAEFHLVDCQVYTEHLARFGATPWPRTRFLDTLAKALTAPMYQGPWNSRTLAPRGRGCG